MNHLLKLLVVIGLAVVHQLIDNWVSLPDDVYNIVSFLMRLIGVVLILNVGYHLLDMYYRKTRRISSKSKDRVTTAIYNLYLLVLVFAVFFMILGFFGVDIQTLFTSLSIVAAAFVILFKEYITPILGGFALVITKDMNIGDYVKIGEHKGKVVNMTLYKLSLLNDDDDLISLPNDKVYQSELVNFSRGNYRKMSIPFEIDAAFEGSLEDLESNLINVLGEYHELIEPESFNLRIESISSKELSLKFQYTLLQVDRKLEQQIRKKTVRQVVNYLRTERPMIDKEMNN